MSITIKVTWRDIHRANEFFGSTSSDQNMRTCPISQAAQRLGIEAITGTNFIRNDKDGRTYRLPTCAQKWVGDYDLSEDPGPITFVAEEI